MRLQCGMKAIVGGLRFRVGMSLAFGLIWTSAALGDGPLFPGAQCEITSVVGSGATSGDGFGWSSAISGDYAVVGTDEPSLSTGTAYIYERDGLAWNEIGSLLPIPALANNDEFGRSVAISGSVAVVGARKHDTNNQTDQGAAYVFRRNDTTGEWLFEKELTADDGAAGDRFGHAVAIDGDWIVVGAPNNDDAGNANGGNSGTAYVYHYGGSVWTEVRKIRASDQAVGDIFGDAVAINGDWIAVGATRDDDACPSDPGCQSGSAYMFFHDPASTPNDWQQLDKVIAQNADGTPDGALGDFFGNAVSISGDRAVVAAWGDDDAGSNSGSVYIFRREGLNWVIEQKLTASDGAAADSFGRFGSVSIRGNLALIGARGGDSPSTTDNRGAAYLYRRAGTTWSEIEKLTASDGLSNDVFGQSVSIGGDFATIGASGAGGKGAAYVFVVGLEADCNENGVQDDCELLGDPSLDVDNNGTLDSCECAIDDDCAGALACLSGTCDQNTHLCMFAADPGFCVIRGVCFDNGALNPDNDCEVCDFVVSDSDWSNRDEGLSCGDSSDSTCDHPDACDGEGLCRTNHEPAGTVCADNGNECRYDQCDGAGACGYPNVADLTPCTDDGNECTDNRCLGGQCSGLFQSDGTPCGDQSDTQCDSPDICDDAGHCLDIIRDDGTPCFDGLFCTGEDSCQGGVCESAGDPCTSDGLICDVFAEFWNVCSCDPAVEGICSDGIFCNGLEFCMLGTCVSSGAPCVGVGLFCDEATDTCKCISDADCEDDDECTGVESCDAEGTCRHTLVFDCNANGLEDACDLDTENGGSPDCDDDGVPDECETDCDGDGFIDDCDACLDSDLAELIVVEQCTSGVHNELLDDGCTMNDVLSECSAAAHSHGELVACVVRRANAWQRQGLLSGKDVGRIVNCAATTNERVQLKRFRNVR